MARYYRPPEIYLGYPYDFSVDVWSFGCTLFELYTGKVLFPGNSDSHMLKLMMEIKGGIPKKMRNQGMFVDKYFDQFNFVNDSEGVRRIPIGEIKKEKSLGVALEGNMVGQGNQIEVNEEERNEIMMFQSLLEQCLELDPNERITPDIALKHPFFSRKNTDSDRKE